jgi:hypothetical protein
MSTTAGVFTETVLNDLRVKADELMFDDRIKQQFIPQIGILDAIAAAQTARITPRFMQLKQSNGGSKKYDVEVEWENACEIVAQDCTVCDITGEKLSTNLDHYSLDFCKEVAFHVDEYDYVDNDFDFITSFAKGFMRADKQLVEALAAYAVSVLNTNKGVNVFAGGPGVVSGSDTYLTAPFWGPNLMAYFMQVTQMNQFSSPVLASGANLFQDYFIFNKLAANADGKGNAALMGTFPIYFDMFNIDTVNTPALITYLLSMGSVALGNRTYNPSRMEENGGANWKRWTVPSKFVPGISYDAFYKQSCSNDMIKHDFKYKLTADILVNPAGCTATNTGILTFVCGAPAT